MKRRVASRIRPESNGQTLGDFLSSRFAYHTPEEWREKIRSGELAIAGETCLDPAKILHTNDLLEYFPANLVEPPVNKDYRIIYEDDDILGVEKPGNLPVHPAGPYFEHTLWALLRPTYSNIHFVNRLDRETSGVMLVAKNPEMAAKLAAELPLMQKSYHVIVHGHFPQAMNAVGVLIKDPDSTVKKKRRFLLDSDRPGESAETCFTLERYGGDWSLLRAELRTGRMHQIRATLHSLDFPVMGDKLYGLDEMFYRRQGQGCLSDDDRQKLRLSRQALHCTELKFTHPATGKLITLSSPLPAEWNEVLPEQR